MRKCSLRLIEFVVVLSVSLVLAPLAPEAHEPGAK